MKPVLMNLTLAVLSMIIAGCTTPPEKEKVYDIKGKVVSVDASKKSVRLDHEDIPGRMKAMEMDFTVADAKLLEGLKVGDQVQGKVKDGVWLITELSKR